MRKRDCEELERLVLAMSQREYEGLVGWLSNGCEGSLWEGIRAFQASSVRTREDRQWS